MKRRAWRAPFVLAALLSLVWGLWLGLVRLGWALPLPKPDQLILHGPLMIGGFLGTVIGLERAIGLARPWPYTAPAASALGAAVLVVGPPSAIGPILITIASGVMTIVFITIVRRQLSLFALTMLAGAAAWMMGNVLWAAGFAIYRIVFWWTTFLVLTIAGERLELNRLLRPTRTVRTVFIVAAAGAVGAAIAIMWAPTTGVRAFGASLIVLASWLAINDIARRTIRAPGLPRYIAVCLLLGYAWLGIAGVIAMITGAFDPGPAYDALLHAIFLGFAVSMIFGHAPIVFPAISGLPLPLRPSFYVPVALLHASVVVRVVGDLADDFARLRPWGGLLNAVAIAAFIVTVASTILSDAAGNPAETRARAL